MQLSKMLLKLKKKRRLLKVAQILTAMLAKNQKLICGMPKIVSSKCLSRKELRSRFSTFRMMKVKKLHSKWVPKAKELATKINRQPKLVVNEINPRLAVQKIKIWKMKRWTTVRTMMKLSTDRRPIKTKINFTWVSIEFT